MLIVLATILELDGSILPSSFYGHLPDCLIYLLDELLFLFLVLLNEMGMLGESKVLSFCYWF